MHRSTAKECCDRAGFRLPFPLPVHAIALGVLMGVQICVFDVWHTAVGTTARHVPQGSHQTAQIPVRTVAQLTDVSPGWSHDDDVCQELVCHVMDATAIAVYIPLFIKPTHDCPTHPCQVHR